MRDQLPTIKAYRDTTELFKIFINSTNPCAYLTGQTSLNFGYCSEIRKERIGNGFAVAAILSVGDSATWICLVSSILPVSIFSIRGLTHRQTKMETNFPATISVLLNGGGNFPSKRNRAVLFVIWMLSSIVFTNIYSGLMTSKLISPNPDIRIRNVEELMETDYSAVYNSPQLVNQTINFIRTSKWSEGLFEEKIIKKLESATITRTFDEYLGKIR